jgi:hypothetical protein
LAEFRKQIALGGKQADRGELVNGDQAFAQIRRRSGQRKRARK